MMRVRMGWSGETDSNVWQKVDVELEDEDLARIFRENDLPDGLADRLPTKVCFQLLQNETEQLLLSKLRTLGYPEDKANSRIAVLLGSSDVIIQQIKNRLALA